MPALVVHEPDRMEDLRCPVRVERGDDRRDRLEVSVHELAEAAAVPFGSLDVELEARNAKGVLDVDCDETDAEAVLERRTKVVLLGPRLCLQRAVLVRDAPDLTDALRVVVGRKR